MDEKCLRVGVGFATGRRSFRTFCARMSIIWKNPASSRPDG